MVATPVSASPAPRLPECLLSWPAPIPLGGWAFKQRLQHLNFFPAFGPSLGFASSPSQQYFLRFKEPSACLLGAGRRFVDERFIELQLILLRHFILLSMVSLLDHDRITRLTLPHGWQRETKLRHWDVSSCLIGLYIMLLRLGTRYGFSASSGIFWEFFIGSDRGPTRRSGRRCRF